MASRNRKAYVITGPTSGIGLATALEVARHGPAVLVGRNGEKLAAVARRVESQGGSAITVECDLSDMNSVQQAAHRIAQLNLPVGGLLHNAGVMLMKAAAKSAQGWDMTFATNYLGAFALTQALVPHLPDGAQVLWVASAIEDPERKPAKVMGMQGGRYLSAQSSSRGIWKPGGSKLPGIDAYATSKQCALAATMFLSREIPRLRFNAIEPGITPGTGLGGRDSNLLMGLLFRYVITFLPPFVRYRSTPERSGRVIAAVLTADSAGSGVYYDEKGKPMRASEQARDLEFQARVVAETRALLSTAMTD